LAFQILTSSISALLVVQYQFSIVDRELRPPPGIVVSITVVVVLSIVVSIAIAVMVPTTTAVVVSTAG
jgi:hypothetical protein